MQGMHNIPYLFWNPDQHKKITLYLRHLNLMSSLFYLFEQSGVSGQDNLIWMSGSMKTRKTVKM